jgi:ubiquinone/menaquinone biosynthesis C-methylase UbiE
MLRVARAKDSPVTWQRGEAEALPFADNSFDLVFSVTTLEFVDDPARALSEMFRVAVPGGRLIVAVLNATSVWGQGYIREALQQDTPFRYARLYTPAEFVRALSVHGQVHWTSSGFFAPSGRGVRLANLLESIGQTFCRGHGALLVGRIDK